MTEQEKRTEVKRLLLFIYQEWSKPITEELVSMWLEALRARISLREAQITARFLITRKTYGEPKLQDFFECLKELRKYYTRPMAVTSRYYDPKAETWEAREESRQIRDIENERKLLPGVEDFIRSLEGIEERALIDGAHADRPSLDFQPSKKEAVKILEYVAPKLLEAKTA